MEGQQALNHVSIRPPRVGMIGEEVMARRWKELMGRVQDGEGRFYHMLRFLPVIEQRTASVAASFVTWLGTSVGSSYLATAKGIGHSAGISMSRAFVAAWAIENVRGANGDHTRMIDYLLRTQDEVGRGTGKFASALDIEVIEQVAIWLGTDEGADFLAGCKEEINRRNMLDELLSLHETGEGSGRRAKELEKALIAPK